MMFPTIEAQTRLQTPPTWAVLERELIDRINDAAPQVLEKIHTSRWNVVLANTSRFSKF